MVRERRKSFFEASRRITEMANTSSQSTIFESPKKKRSRRQEQSDETIHHAPARRSNRLRGIQVPQLSLSGIVTRRQTRSAKSKNNSKNQNEPANDEGGDASHSRVSDDPSPVQANKIQCRRVTVYLERLNIGTMRELFDIGNPPERRLSSHQPSDSVIHVSPRKITTRRCTIDVDRMDFSSYRPLPTIEEHVQEDVDNEAEIQDELEIEQYDPPQLDVQIPELDIQLVDDIDKQTDETLNEPVEEMEVEETEPIHSLSAAEVMQTQSSAKTFVDTLSSIISDQNKTMYMRPSTPTLTQRTSADSTLTPGKLVQMMETQSDDTEDSSLSLSQMNLGRDEDVASTYFHTSVDRASANHGRAMVPFRNNHLQSSQTDTQISWNLHRSISDDSLAVGYSQSYSDINTSDTAVIEPKKCFIDSEHISYGCFIKYSKDTFAVNCFDHGNTVIKHHFLSKFCRTYFSALNPHFTGHLWMTNTTARLMERYSTVDRNHVHILEYGKETRIGNAVVTAIEVPNFPGGALFLFTSKNQKTILHVGNFRLTSELEQDDVLTNSNIDEIRFDESILSGLFYQAPPDADRYIHLMHEIGKFMDASDKNGLQRVIAFGAFEIGMEFLIYRLVKNFNCKVYMSAERIQFLASMEVGYDDSDTIIQNLRKELIDNPDKALVHILPVEDISLENLTQYIATKNYHRVLGIRPRGCDCDLQTVVDGVNRIIDIANPLIGDLTEYERFVRVHTDQEPRIPADHGEKAPSSAPQPYRKK